MQKKSSSSVYRLTQLGLLAAVAVVLGLFKFPVLPVAPFLEFDFADTPILLGTLLFGGGPGLAILAVVSAIQAFFLGGNGLIGFAMHFIASGTMLLTAGAIYRSRRTFTSLLLGLICGTIAMTLVMIPLNYLLTPLYIGATSAQITALLLPGIVPFNLIKAGGNCLLAGILFKLLRPVFVKLGIITEQ